MSRRDEVWERKRQIFLSRQNGDAASAMSRNSGMSRLSRPAGGAGEDRAPSPLSRLVNEGYPETVAQAQGTPTTRHYNMQAYAQGGSRPNSRQMQPPMQQPQQQDGFHGGVAQQWSNNVQKGIAAHQQQNDPNFTGPKRPQGYKVAQAPGGVSSINLSWGEAPNRAPSPKRRPEGMAAAGGRAPSPSERFQAPSERRYDAGAGMAGIMGGARYDQGNGADRRHEAPLRQPSPARHYEAPGRQPSPARHYEGAAGMATAPGQRHPCYGDPQQVPIGRAPSPGGRRMEAAMGGGQMHAAGFQAPQANRGGAPFAYDGGPPSGGGAKPPLPRQASAAPWGQDPFVRDQPNVSSNVYANGGNQNCGNVITDRRSTRVSHPPGGGSSICFG